MISIVLLTLFGLLCVHSHTLEEYQKAVENIDWNAVKQDIRQMLVDSQDFWPADFGNYGPFMIRQAWHCAGSYRSSDGHGGCDGARQRFDPERSWEDNTNLDKAKRLIWPIKQKYGLGLSWGDLIVLTGNVAIESMGGPVLGFCAGRVDDEDGSDSEILGPTDLQEQTYPCAENGACKRPFGTTTIGLIYVNPEGPLGNPVPRDSALEVRDTFSRMNMNDLETVALVGGGHAFGKTHGACPLGPGPSPKEDPANPWPGKCGSGKGKDAFTSGFEGTWTPTPTKWSNYYYQQLVNLKWNKTKSPGGPVQWVPTNGRKVTMLTADLALVNDPEGKYQPYVKLFANNIAALEDAFSKAWYKLTTRDMGPVSRCVGPDVPPAQPFQYPLPPTPTNLPNFKLVAQDIQKILYTNLTGVFAPDTTADRRPYYGALLTHVAWQCASTFRKSDYLGGCNGARILYADQSWRPNNGIDLLLEVLQPIKDKYGDNLSWADLIVLAGTVAIADGISDKSIPVTFCGGRTDATDASGWESLEPNGDMSDGSALYELINRMKFSPREIVALTGRLRSPSQLKRIGFVYGSWTDQINVLSNDYFVTLIEEDWTKFSVGTGYSEYKSVSTPTKYLTPLDLQIRYDAATLAIAQDFASDNKLFTQEFVDAWTKLMNIDRYDGPVKNLCDAPGKKIILN